MTKRINPVNLLKQRQGKRSLREFSKQVGVTAAYLSDLYRGNRDPGPRILEFLGLEREVKRAVAYKRKESNNGQLPRST
jgi:transcriptional regulator with XRE-family HTH domain